jgi:hypothetical protein
MANVGRLCGHGGRKELRISALVRSNERGSLVPMIAVLGRHINDSVY